MVDLSDYSSYVKEMNPKSGKEAKRNVINSDNIDSVGGIL